VPVLGRADWAVVDTGDPWVVRDGSPILSHDEIELARFVERLRAAPRWSVIWERDGVVVLRRA
jgi:hypothetical protein